MAPLTKGASDRARELTRDQDFQVSSLSASVSRLLCSFKGPSGAPLRP
jgi:hypothetical protein